MIERAPRKGNSRKLAVAACAGICAAVTMACGPNYFEIPIETPIQPKLDVSAFQRVLVAGFVTGGTEDVDANQETVRLLRSQLRTKSSLRIIDADVMPLVDIAQDQNKMALESNAPVPEGTSAGPGAANGTSPANGNNPANGASPANSTGAANGANAADKPTPLPTRIKDEKDLEPYERLFANTAYWKKLGEEYQNPLIVTGTVLFMPNQSSGFVNREVEQYDSFGRRMVVPVRTYMERKGFILRPKFIFIDGNTGATLYSESYREEVLYNAQQNMPALSSYFELMDRLIPNFLSALSTQKIKGTRVLLK
jgi:hypothetical protein